MANAADGHSPAAASADINQWDGDRMFNIYIHDYCVKHGYINTAQALMREAGIQDAATPPINAKQGLLFEWWNVFWVLFSAKSNISTHPAPGQEDALVYLQHQSQRQQQQSRIQAQSGGRYMNGIRPGSHIPNGPIPNGVPNGVPGNTGPMPNGAQGASFIGSQPNGVPGTTAGPNGAAVGQLSNAQMMPGGQRVNLGAPGQQPSATPGMSQMGGPQPIVQMSRSMLPPNATQGTGPSHTPQPGVQQLGRSPSQPASPAPNGIIPSPSPSMSARQPPGMHPGGQIDGGLNEILRLPPDQLQRLRQETGVGDKDLPSLTGEEKQRLMNAWRRRSGPPKPPGPPTASAGAGPSGSNPPMQLHQQRNPAPPGSQPLTPQLMPGQANQRGNKRNSTSPGQEAEQLPKNESSPPDRKRQRRATPGPDQQQAPQLPPQMQPGAPPPGAAPFHHPLHQGAPPPMSNGMRPPMHTGFVGQPGMHPMSNNPSMPMTMGPSMGAPHMGNVMSPAMSHPPPNNMPMNQLNQMQHREQQYRQTMHNLHKNNLPPNVLGNILPQGVAGSPSNTDGQFPGGPPMPGGPNRLVQNKMMPPPSPGMNAMKKDGDSSAPNVSPQNAAVNVAQGLSGVSTAPPTPGAGMAAPSPSAVLSNHGTPAMMPSNPPAPSMSSNQGEPILTPDFMQSIASLGTFDESIFGQGDQSLGVDFEKDFGEWFNPDTGL